MNLLIDTDHLSFDLILKYCYLEDVARISCVNRGLLKRVKANVEQQMGPADKAEMSFYLEHIVNSGKLLNSCNADHLDSWTTLLERACRKGLVRCVSFLSRHWCSKLPLLFSQCLSAGCKNGHLNVVRYLVEQQNVSPTNESVEVASLAGHLPVVVFLCENFDFSTADIRAGENKIIYSACKGGHVDIARFLVEKYGLTVADFRDGSNRALISACRSNRASLVKYMVEEVGLAACDFRDNLNNALFTACVFSDSVDVIRYAMSDRVGLTKEHDLLLNDNELLIAMCGAGSEKTLKFLVEEVGVSANDLRANGNAALRCAAWHGRLAVLRCLHETVGLTITDARAQHNEALRIACANGDIAIVEYLVKSFGLTAADAATYDNEAMVKACENGHIDVIRFLMGPDVGLTAGKIRAKCTAALQRNCPKDLLRLLVKNKFVKNKFVHKTKHK